MPTEKYIFDSLAKKKLQKLHRKCSHPLRRRDECKIARPRCGSRMSSCRLHFRWHRQRPRKLTPRRDEASSKDNHPKAPLGEHHSATLGLLVSRPRAARVPLTLPKHINAKPRGKYVEIIWFYGRPSGAKMKKCWRRRAARPSLT